jgi:DNA-binding XRE family transcriptional regulator
MHYISAAQIKAARAMLDWSQGELAIAAGLSLTTIRSLEMGYPPRSNTLRKICKTIEDSGLELTESEGIKRRNTEIKFYQGRDSCDQFFDDMLQTVKQKGGEIVAVFKSKEAMIQSCGMINDTLGQLEPFGEIAPIKCLLSEPLEPSLLCSSFQFRIISKQIIGPISYFAYGDKHAFILAEGNSAFRFIVYNIAELAQSYKDHFQSLWDNAPPVLIAAGSMQDRRIRA